MLTLRASWRQSPPVQATTTQGSGIDLDAIVAGIRLKCSNPMEVDDVAADFPGLPIVLAHPSFPSRDEVLAVATHKPLGLKGS